MASRSSSLLTTTTRSGIAVQRPATVQATKRYVELASNQTPDYLDPKYPPWLREALTPVSDEDEVVTANNPGPDISAEEANAIRRPRAVQLAYLRPFKRQAQHRIPSCNLQIRSYSARNLEFFTTFALRAAYYLKLPAVGPVPLPKQIERWTVPRAHFVHKKSQENFERITLRRLIQIQDGHPETIQMWLAYLRKRSYYGVGMKANVWSFEKIGCGKDMDIEAEQGQSLESRWRAQFSGLEIASDADGLGQPDTASQKESSAEFSTVAAPSVRDSVKDILSGPTDFGEALANLQQSMKNLVMPSSEQESVPKAKQALSESQKIAEILKGIELDAAKSLESEKQTRESLPESGETEISHQAVEVTQSDSSANEGTTGEEATAAGQVNNEPKLEKEPVQSSSVIESSPEETASKPAKADQVTESEAKSTILSATKSNGTAPQSSEIDAEEKLPVMDQAAKETSPADATEKTSISEQVEAPTTPETKDVPTPDEANPAVEAKTEAAKEAEAEDAGEPLGSLPKTPS